MAHPNSPGKAGLGKSAHVQPVHREDAPCLMLFGSDATNRARHRCYERNIEIGPAETDAGRLIDWQANNPIDCAIGRKPDETPGIELNQPEETLGLDSSAIRITAKPVK